MLLLLSIVKAIGEILMLTLLGQGVLWLIAGKSRETNFVYKLFAAVTRPVMLLARLIMPRFVLDRHIWMVGVLIVLMAWIFAGQQKLLMCKGEAAADPLCVEIAKSLKEREAEKAP